MSQPPGWSPGPASSPWEQPAAPPPPGYGAPPGYGPLGSTPPGTTPGYPGYGYGGPQRTTNQKAIIALVLSIASYPTCGPFMSIPAMILARSAKREIAAAGGWQEGEGLATAGFWIGLVNCVLYGLLAVLYIVIFVIIAAAGTTDTGTY